MTWCLNASSFAADDAIGISGEGAVGDDAVIKEKTGSASTMMRQTSPVLGYQSLLVAGQEIDSAYVEETLGSRHGVIVFFHDQGEAFESNGVITPLRHQLPEHGWSTLTLSHDLPFESNIMLSASRADQQVPVEGESNNNAALGNATEDANGDVATGNKIKNLVPPPVPNKERVEAALTMLQAKGFERVIFLGHGKGAEVAIAMLDSQTLPVVGLILVGMADVDIDDDFKGSEIPVLEVYGEYDLSGVEMAIKQRRASMKRVAKTNYSVRQVLGANHVFYGLESMLLMTVRSWLKVTIVDAGKE